MKPLLSICIPTYNRSNILKEFLETITSAEEFNEEVELVISDNCSTDDTEKICKKYLNWPNIKYFKNDENLRDKNFWIILHEATGEYRKLQNDWALITNDGLKTLKVYVKKYKYINIFFTNGQIRETDNKICYGINEYVSNISSYVTSIGFFGVWEKDLQKINNPYKYFNFMLMQEDWTYQLITNNPSFIIINDSYFVASRQNINRSVKYNWFEVQIDYYYQIMSGYFGNGNNCISLLTYKNDLKTCFRHFKRDYLFCKMGIFTTYSPVNIDNIFDKYFNGLKEYRIFKHFYYVYWLLFPYYYVKYTDNSIKKYVKLLIRRP